MRWVIDSLRRVFHTRSTRLLWPIVGLVMAIVLVALIPSLLATSAIENDSSEMGHSLQRLTSNFMPEMWTYGPLILFTAVASILVYHGFILKREHRQIIRPVTEVRGSTLITGVVVCILLTIVAVSVSASETGVKWQALLANNPGGWFAIITGVLGLVGVYLTLATVLEVRNSIVSFADFIYRADQLIRETSERDCIQMMLHTPAPGCLALPVGIWRTLADTIKTCHKPISLTCLCQDEMYTWFQAYTKNLDGDQLGKMIARIKIGLDESSKITQEVNATAEQSSDITIDIGVVEAEWNDLPLCYYIANSRRAIVVAPFFLPRPGANIYESSVYGQPIQMIGFETADYHIVNTVNQEIRERRKWICGKKGVKARVTEGQTAQAAAAGVG
jgi:hypothetical protein